MLHHFSIAAQNPAHVADVLAEILQGKSFPFPVFPDAYIVVEGDHYGTAIEIVPLGMELIPGDQEVTSKINQFSSDFTATHVAISVSISREEIERICHREGWKCLYCDRGPFDLVEVWIENRLLLELLPPNMSSRYTDFMTISNFDKFISAVAG